MPLCAPELSGCNFKAVRGKQAGAGPEKHSIPLTQFRLKPDSKSRIDPYNDSYLLFKPGGIYPQYSRIQHAAFQFHTCGDAMLTGTSLSSGMYLPYEIISEIFKYTLDARPLNEYSFCLNDKSEPRNLELISRWFERDVKRILREERPEIMRAIAAGALSRIALHWTGDMEKVGPQRDLFVKNVKSVTERCSHLALDLDDILACGAGYGLSATDIHHSITTILEVIRNQYQKDFPIQSFEFKAPAAVNFSSPGFFRASGHFETGFMRLFWNWAILPKTPEIKRSDFCWIWAAAVSKTMIYMI